MVYADLRYFYFTNNKQSFNLTKPTSQTKGIEARLYFEIVCNKNKKFCSLCPKLPPFLSLIFAQDVGKSLKSIYIIYETPKHKGKQQLIFLQDKYEEVIP